MLLSIMFHCFQALFLLLLYLFIFPDVLMENESVGGRNNTTKRCCYFFFVFVHNPSMYIPFQHLGGGFTCNYRLDNFNDPGTAYLCGIIGNLDIASVQWTVNLLLYAGGLFAKPHIPPAKLTQFLNLFAGYITPPYQVFLNNSGYPFRIFYIRFSTWQLPDKIGVNQFQTEMPCKISHTGIQ